MKYRDPSKQILDPLKKRGILIEALSYIKQFTGQTIVMKYGGAAMVQEDCKVSFAQDIVLLRSLGLRPVVVHGGGPEISKAITSFGVEPKFIDGLRVTDLKSMKISEMVLSGQVNKEIVTSINHAEGLAVGLSGKDGRMIEAVKLEHPDHDLGFVGQIESINPALINNLLDDGYIPVISPIGMGKDGNSYNINADTAASHIAAALKAYKVIFLTDVQGVMEGEKQISRLNKEEVNGLIKSGVIAGGMIPKVQGMLFALEAGVGSAHIIGGMDSHALIGELFTDRGNGTMITLN